jgi:hypothetical protein
MAVHTVDLADALLLWSKWPAPLTPLLHGTRCVPSSFTSRKHGFADCSVSHRRPSISCASM